MLLKKKTKKQESNKSESFTILEVKGMLFAQYFVIVTHAW